MFTAKSEKTDNGASITMEYTLFQVPKKETINANSMEIALRKFIPFAHDYLREQLDELSKELFKISPHYFDRYAKPYLPAHIHFPIAYWKFLTMKGKLLKYSTNAYRTAHECKNLNMEDLVPFHIFNSNAKIQEHIETIKNVSEKIIQSINTLEKWS